MSNITFIDNDDKLVIEDYLMFDNQDFGFRESSPFQPHIFSQNKNRIKYIFLGFCLFGNDVLSNETILFTESTSENHSFIEEYDKSLIQPFCSYLEDISPLVNYSKTQLITKIISFKSLNENWDGFGAIPLEVKSAANAIYLIDLIGEKIFCSIEEIYPNPHGTISLIWTNISSETVSVEVGNDTLSYYVDLLSTEPKFFNDVKINSKVAKEISEFIQKL